MASTSLTRRDFLTGRGRTRPPRRAPLPERLKPLLRPAILLAGLFCWALVASTTVHLTAASTGTISIGLHDSPWLVCVLGGSHAPSALSVYPASWSSVVALAGYVLLKAYFRPRVMAALRSLIRSLRRR
jgi:hypothetical protein